MENNLTLYHVFLSVATCGNITKAAEELYISQPAVSKSIQKLESSLGVTLFTRNTRGVSLTYEGKLLHQEISKAFDAIHEGENHLRNCLTLGISYLRIGVSSTLCKYVLLPYLKKFIQKYPHVRISIECQSTYETMKLLEDGRIDIGLVGAPDEINHLDFFSLGTIEDVFVASPQYLKHLQERIETQSDDNQETTLLEKGTLMLLNKENITRQHIERYFRDISFSPTNLIEVTSMDLLIDFAKIGLGIACVIKDFVAEEIKNNQLIPLPLSLAIPKREIGFIYCGSSTSSVAVRNFIEIIKS